MAIIFWTSQCVRGSEGLEVVWCCLVVSLSRLSGFVLFAIHSICCHLLLTWWSPLNSIQHCSMWWWVQDLMPSLSRCPFEYLASEPPHHHITTSNFHSPLYHPVTQPLPHLFPDPMSSIWPWLIDFGLIRPPYSHPVLQSPLLVAFCKVQPGLLVMWLEKRLFLLHYRP